MFSRTISEIKLNYALVFAVTLIGLYRFMEFAQNYIAIIIMYLSFPFIASLIATVFAVRRKGYPIKPEAKSVKKQIFTVNIIVFVAIKLLMVIFSWGQLEGIALDFILGVISFIPAVIFSVNIINKVYKKNVIKEKENDV